MWSLPNPQSLFKLTDYPKTCNPAYKTLYQLWYNKKKLRKKNLLFHLLIFQVNEDVFKESDYPFPQLWQTFGIACPLTRVVGKGDSLCATDKCRIFSILKLKLHSVCTLGLFRAAAKKKGFAPEACIARP